jgi:hypothetical protein
VVTFWEGEIVDNKNYTFYTGKWEATKETDVKHWSKFSSFEELRLGADEVSEQLWQLITAISDDGDGLTLCG